MGTVSGPCRCLSKQIVFYFNFILFIMGSLSVAVGLWVHYDKKSFSDFLTKIDHSSIRFEGLSAFTHEDALTDAYLLLIISGAIICIVSFLGCCGVCQSSTCMLTLYGCFILLFLAMQIAAGCLAFFYEQKVSQQIKGFLKSTIADYNESPTSPANSTTLMWNYLMAQLSCCGVDDYTDFMLSPKWNASGLTVPKACCSLGPNKFEFLPLDPNCMYKPTEVNSYYRKGCYEIVSNWVMTNSELVLYVGIGLATFQLLLMVMAFCLSKTESKYDNGCC